MAACDGFLYRIGWISQEYLASLQPFEKEGNNKTDRASEHIFKA